MAEEVRQLVLEGVEIGFKNFRGEEGAYNRKGDRNFVIFLDNDMATKLSEQGWNIKFPKPLEEPDDEDTRNPYLQVSIGEKGMPPKIVMVDEDNGNEVLLNFETMDILDDTVIRYADVIIRPYHWVVNGNSGIKAYLKTLYANIEPDVFGGKYKL